MSSVIYLSQKIKLADLLILHFFMKCSGRIFRGHGHNYYFTENCEARISFLSTTYGKRPTIRNTSKQTYYTWNWKKSRLFPFHNQNLVKGLRPAMTLNILCRLIIYIGFKKSWKLFKLFQVSVAMVSQTKNKFPILNGNSKFFR